MKAINELNAAVVGTGFISAVHIDSIRRLGVNIAGIVGSSAERAKEKALQFGIGHAYGSYDDMLADPAVDVVHITSPNDDHPAQAEAALKAGKHVICEKPLALTSGQTDRLRKIAAETGRVAAVNFNIRFYPQVHEMRSRIRDGSTGTPFLVTGSYMQDWLLYDTDWNWRVEEERGGDLRVVGDIGSHWFDLASFVMGQPIVEVMAELPTFIPIRKQPIGPVETFSNLVGGATIDVTIQSEDAALIVVRFRDGARGVVTASQVSAGHKNGITLEINGAKSSVAWRGERPDELWIGHRSRPNEILMRDPSLLSPEAAAIATLPGGHGEGFENGFKAMYRAVYADIAAGGPSNIPAYATFEDGHEEALIVEAVAESARTGRWCAVKRD
ncbi:Gfo/Idh/MocA family protein [Rhizobium lusitanum]|uniref:Gfo/Idh/MocA family protein n=1 Tax=Rhizobium lusitanum TaxID=293958 RepID=UPI0019592566|nr:Gfo/Idh/MocA family oxidoreductase [Rhizobium lusitanum]MBM7044784.1 Gfo/Idh/MocA family oxidoreductase [Rhizobium lusitanum]